jgi:nucleoside-diphosphate-sugar epimerase
MKQTVALFGASGTMGRAAFKELWKRRDRYNIVLLVRPSEKNKRLFQPYEKLAGAASIAGAGISEAPGFRIVWGDATRYDDAEQAVHGADWVLDAMAYISPEADYYPEQAKAVNTDGIVHIVRAIEAQPGGAERIRLIYTGTVAETGDRLGCIHMGRVGDPLKPSIFDSYATSKIAGERAVLESNIRHWASLRMTYIMATTYKEFSAMNDPIMFHQPVDSCHENITDRDAGFGMVNCLDIPDESDFWRRAYNMGGGPRMRIVMYDLFQKVYGMNGMSGIEAVSERRWYALRNFHMQYYEDSTILNDYLHYWRDSLEDFYQEIAKTTPVSLKAVAFLAKRIPAFRKMVEQAAYKQFKNLVENHRNGTAYWYNHRNDMRITAFYKDYATYEAIPDWNVDMPQMDPLPACTRLSHGYEEGKARLDLNDLRGAAQFRGGECLSAEWDGDMFAPVHWKCAFDHTFTAKPNTVLKAGHWCPDCAPPPWNYDEEARRNPFFAQVWYPNHDPGENNFYPADCVKDIDAADKEFARRR